MTRCRDAKGRFCRVAKKPPLDPELVRVLGRDRKAVIWTGNETWVLTGWRRVPPTTPSPDE
jgi:hypothetical protein